MKNIILLLLAAFTFTAQAQLTLLPQIGIDNTKTTLKSNDFTSFSPLGLRLLPQFGARLGYTAKSGHGAYIGVSTSGSAVEYRFTDPQTAGTSFKASGEDLNLHLEAGYQFSSKPIALSKAGGANKPGYRNNGSAHHGCAGRMSCGQHSSCSGHSACSQRRAANHVSKSSVLFMRIKPSIGLAFVPSEGGEIENDTRNGQTNYEYKAGWNTAVTAGTAFEFGSRNQSKFVVSVNYIQSLGSNKQTLTTTDNSKTTAHTFQSNTSGFSISLGIPINLTPKKHSAQSHRQCGSSSHCMSRCGQYRMFFQQ